jgi:hypothetical protein
MLCGCEIRKKIEIMNDFGSTGDILGEICNVRLKSIIL